MTEPRKCRVCAALLPDAPIARYHVCVKCGWEPIRGPQSRFMACTAYEALFGGSAGGSKTSSIVIAPLDSIGVPTFRALILRRTFPELVRDIVPLAWQHYPTAGGVFNVSTKTWTFPSGAVIEFGHAESEMSVHAYQGLEVQYLAFDELTSFTEYQYRYMLSRVRSSVSGLRVRVRSATNPGGVGHDWVFRRWAPWLDPNSPIHAKANETLHYRNVDDTEQWCERGADTLARVFFPSRLTDNPYLDDGYATRLGGLDRVSRAQLRDGDWLIQPAAGAYYRRAWFPVLDVSPAVASQRVRHWDLASTEDGGDWTVGVRMALMSDRTFVIEDVVRVRQRPQGVEATILATAQIDGRAVHVSIPQDPGQAGKGQVAAFAKMLVGYTIRSAPETGSKVTRQEPLSAQCEAGNVSMVRGEWNAPFLSCLEGFPDGAHDDDVDAAAGAFTYLAGKLGNLNYAKALEVMARDLR